MEKAPQPPQPIEIQDPMAAIDIARQRHEARQDYLARQEEINAVWDEAHATNDRYDQSVQGWALMPTDGTVETGQESTLDAATKQVKNSLDWLTKEEGRRASTKRHPSAPHQMSGRVKTQNSVQGIRSATGNSRLFDKSLGEQLRERNEMSIDELIKAEREAKDGQQDVLVAELQKIRASKEADLSSADSAKVSKDTLSTLDILKPKKGDKTEVAETPAVEPKVRPLKSMNLTPTPTKPDGKIAELRKKLGKDAPESETPSDDSHEKQPTTDEEEPKPVTTPDDDEQKPENAGEPDHAEEEEAAAGEGDEEQGDDPRGDSQDEARGTNSNVVDINSRRRPVQKVERGDMPGTGNPDNRQGRRGSSRPAGAPGATQTPEQPATAASPETHESLLERLEVGFAEEALHGEDSMLINQEKGVFGIFDGAGGEGNAKAASNTARDAVNEYLSNLPTPTSHDEAVEQLKAAMQAAREAVAGLGEGVTTAVFGRFYETDEGLSLAVANAGDSRSYGYNPHKPDLQGYDKGEPVIGYSELTSDQSRGRYLQNAINADQDWTPGVADEYRVAASGMSEGVKFMFCSDGITGDHEGQFFTVEEMLEGFEGSAQESAEKFLEISKRPGKKSDDKSVIVIRVGAKETQAASTTPNAPTTPPLLQPPVQPTRPRPVPQPPVQPARPQPAASSPETGDDDDAAGAGETGQEPAQDRVLTSVERRWFDHIALTRGGVAAKRFLKLPITEEDYTRDAKRGVGFTRPLLEEGTKVRVDGKLVGYKEYEEQHGLVTAKLMFHKPVTEEDYENNAARNEEIAANEAERRANLQERLQNLRDGERKNRSNVDVMTRWIGGKLNGLVVSGFEMRRELEKRVENRKSKRALGRASINGGTSSNDDQQNATGSAPATPPSTPNPKPAPRTINSIPQLRAALRR